MSILKIFRNVNLFITFLIMIFLFATPKSSATKQTGGSHSYPVKYSNWVIFFGLFLFTSLLYKEYM